MKHIFLALAGLLSFGLTSPASAYSELIVFGDSLVDSGNARIGALSLGFPDPANPAFGYSNGRFSNGPNFVDHINAGLFGATSTPYLAGGLNFGVGGAAALNDPSAVSPGFLAQLSLFQSTGHAINPDSLIIVTFGGNDIRDVLTTPGTVDFAQNLADFKTGIQALVGAGAKNIVITGVPNIGALPATAAVAFATSNPGIIPLATQRSIFLNDELEKIATDPFLSSLADIDFFDLLGLEQTLLANPAAFGLPPLNTTTPCQLAGPAAVLSGCNGYLYFDAIHPTTQVHAVIATQIAQQLNVAIPEPRSWALMILGLALMGGVLRARTPRLQLA